MVKTTILYKILSISDVPVPQGWHFSSILYIIASSVTEGMSRRAGRSP